MFLQHMLPHQLERARQEGWPLLLPTGCIEYHGPHNILGLDAVLVQELLGRAAERVDCVVAPPVWYGPASYAVAGAQAGTLDVSTDTFGRHVKDVLTGFWRVGFRWIVVGVHHQQMDGPESLAIRQAAAEVIFERAQAERSDGWWGRAPLAPSDNVFERIQVWPSVLPSAAAHGAEIADHAGFYETSLMMAANPEWVELDRLGMSPPWYCVTGERKAREASVAEGNRLWEVMVDAWVDRLAALAKPRRPSPKDVTVRGLF